MMKTVVFLLVLALLVGCQTIQPTSRPQAEQQTLQQPLPEQDVWELVAVKKTPVTFELVMSKVDPEVIASCFTKEPYEAGLLLELKARFKAAESQKARLKVAGDVFELFKRQLREYPNSQTVPVLNDLHLVDSAEDDVALEIISGLLVKVTRSKHFPPEKK